jgi:hypothetical protein
MVVADVDAELAESRRLPTVTLEGWREFVDTKPATLTPDAVTDARTSGRADADYNDRRLAYHSELVIVETSSVREVVRQGRLLMLLNRREIGARRALIVDGPWASGKSTSIKWLGRTHEQWVRTRNPDPGGDRIPVAYITTPPKGSPRKLASEFAHFLGLPDRARHNTTDITDAVSHVLTEARTDLVLDEIHNLNLATSAGEDMSDHLKYFTEHPGHLRVRRHQRRTRWPVHRGARATNLGPLGAGAHRPVSLRGRMAIHGGHHGDRAATSSPPSRHPGAQREIPAPTHRWQHLQPLAARAHRSTERHPHRL